MWELVNQLSHGRYPARRFSLMVMSAVLTFFVATTAFTTPVHADDTTATRNGDTISYLGNTYTEVKKEELPKDIQAKAQGGYKYIDTAGKKAYFIYTTDAPSKAATGSYVIYDFTPPDNFSNPSPPVEVTFDDGTSASTSDCDTPELSGIGWLACPVINFLAWSMDQVYGFISNFLVINTITNDTNSSIYQLWMIVRDIANICFVIAILAVVYSQITSVGITNYGIKKILPRLVIAAILVNISFWICALAVDASNILGYGIHSLFSGVMERFSVGANYSGTGDVPTWQQAAFVILSGGAATVGVFSAGTVGGALALLLPFLLSAIVSALVALIVLAARQALITLLIIISPLAFVAYILPNTEKWFTKWRETLMTLLLLFPIFSAVFSGAQLAGMAIVQSANGNIFTILLGMAVVVTPIVITPLLIKLSGNIIGKLAGIVNNPSKGLVDRSRNVARNFAEQQRDKVAGRQNKIWSPLGGTTRAIDTYKRNLAKNRESYKTAAGNRYSRTNSGMNAEDLKQRVTNDTKRAGNEYFEKRGMAHELESRNLDVDKQELETVMTGSADGDRLTYRQGMAEFNKTRVHNDFESSSLGHQVDRAKRTVERQKQTIENDHQASWDNAIRTDSSLLEVDLAAKHSEGRAEAAKKALEQMHTEIVAQGHNSEHILNLRGVSAQTQAGLLNIAHDIKTDSFNTQVIASAQNMAERKIKEQFAENLSKSASGDIDLKLEGTPVHLYAGGIMGQAGVNSVVARAKTEFSSVMVESIKNVKNTLKYEDSTNPDTLLAKFQDPSANLEDKVAYAWTMTERGSPGNIALRKAIEYMDNNYAPDSSEIQDFKELLGSMSGAMKAGKDIEFWITNTRDKRTGDLRNLRDLSNDSGTWNALQVEAFAGMNMISQLKALRTYARDKPDLYDKLVADLTESTSYSAIKPTVKDAMKFAPDARDPADPTRLYWSDEAIRDRAGSPTLDFNDPW